MDQSGGLVSIFFFVVFFFFSSRRRHTRCGRDWSSDVCSSDLAVPSVRAAAVATMSDFLFHMLNRKSLIVATAAALTLGTAALPSQAHANDNGLLGAVVGAGIGAAIGHNVHGHNGALVGGAIGAIAGASIAAQSSSYYDRGYYAAPADVYAPATEYYAAPEYYSAPAYYGATSTYYAPAPTYYAPAPVYYPR